MNNPDNDNKQGPIHIDLRNIPREEWGKKVLQAVAIVEEIKNGKGKEKTIH